MPAKNYFFNTIVSAYYFLKKHLHHFSKIKIKKLLFLHDDRRIRIRIQCRIRIHTSDKWIRIQEAQKHVDPVDPDSDPDPQHCLKVAYFIHNLKKFYTFFTL
jgi:hypothetical protein